MIIAVIASKYYTCRRCSIFSTAASLRYVFLSGYRKNTMTDKSNINKGKNEPNKIREGQEDSSILHDQDAKEEKSYPRPSVPDRRFDQQPEFLDPESNRLTDDSEQ